ncbi:LysR family transcriptional regulator [Simiduia sp. 21SJ11W-1]|uniref:LysR family transcriptional regulator n=1 Tax=Simiduia sp. 21SJ11W-1 TaxID=2909669 RepID=UPI00209CDCB6|nr:LysR family transcriptional regulator [Simiduia sp. 21SJ11W-1]UTA46765.1 LysR family transcriptional regulator [Simiduia sp. 21SJ11W-1]
MKQPLDQDPRLLRLFMAVAECGGLSAAEQRLGLSRSTISTHLSELESRLGFRLCQRGRGGFALTPEGEATYQAAKHWMAAGEAFQQQVLELQHRQLQGELIIAISDDSLNHPNFSFSEVVQRFRAQAPGAHLRVSSLNPSAIAEAIGAGQAHIGLAPQSSLTERFYSKVLYQEQSFLYCAASHPLFDARTHNRQALLQQDFVGAGYSWHAALTEREAPFNTCAIAPELEARLALILSGTYLGFLPEHVAAPWVAKGSLTALLPDELHYTTKMAAHCQSQQRSNKLLHLLFALLNDVHYVNAKKN